MFEKFFKKNKQFRVRVAEEFARDTGIALGRLGLTADVSYTGNHEYTLTGKWTPSYYGDEKTLEALTMLPVREAVVF